MLKIEIKTAYSEESFVILDWDNGRATDFHGHPFWSVEGYINFYFSGIMAFGEDFEIVSIAEATEADIEEAKRIAKDNWVEEFDFELLETLAASRNDFLER